MERSRIQEEAWIPTGKQNNNDQQITINESMMNNE